MELEEDAEEEEGGGWRGWNGMSNTVIDVDTVNHPPGRLINDGL